MRLGVWLISACALAFSDPVRGGQVEAALKLISAGETSKAIQKLERSNKPVAAFYLADLAVQDSYPGCDLNCALRLYQKAADGGFLPAVIGAGMLFWNDGQKEKGLGLFQLAARWNLPDARRILADMGEDVPEPDLLNAHLADLNQRAIANEALWAAMAPALSYSLGCAIAGAACAPAPLVTQNQRIPIIQRPQQQTAPARLCPDGSYIIGSFCHLAPDGQYLPDRAQLAPDGTYVAGRPRLAPDGKYIGGNGPIRLCPDGRYVSGTRCRLLPDGSYAGE